MKEKNIRQINKIDLAHAEDLKCIKLFVVYEHLLTLNLVQYRRIENPKCTRVIQLIPQNSINKLGIINRHKHK